MITFSMLFLGVDCYRAARQAQRWSFCRDLGSLHHGTLGIEKRGVPGEDASVAFITP
jgi:hypothetical protein